MSFDKNQIQNLIKNKNTLFEYLLSNVVIKSYKKEVANATTESKIWYSRYRDAVKGIDDEYSYDSYEMKADILRRYQPTLDDIQVAKLQLHHILLTDVMSEANAKLVLEELRNNRINTYVELNEYYRMLMGIPPLDVTEDEYIYIDGYTKPLHEFNFLEITDLIRKGEYELIVNKYSVDDRTAYIKYMQYNLKDILFLHESEPLQILYTPAKDEFDRYRQCYNRELVLYRSTYFNEYMMSTSSYNEEMEITFLKVRALIMYEISVYNPSLDKKNFTTDECREIWKTFNLSFPKKMPLSYLNSITFVINYLVMFKGTNYVVKYISDKIFNGIKLYKYFIRKKVKKGISFPIPPGTPPEDVYDVEFLLRPFDSRHPGETEGTAKEAKILTYDEVVMMDPRWRDTEELKRKIFSTNFSYSESKYIALNNFVSLMKFSEELSILIRLMVENKDKLNSVYIKYDTTGKSHKFFDFFVYFLACFTSSYMMTQSQAPDTVSRIKTLIGFKIPDNFDEIRMYFLWYFSTKPWADLLDKFPEAPNSLDSFIDLLVKIDHMIGIGPIFDEIIPDCTYLKEVDFILDLKRIFTEVKSTPTAFGVVPSTDGITYGDYLKSVDLDLYTIYDNLMVNIKEDGGREALVLEFDIIVQTLNKFLDEKSTVMEPLNNIKNTIGETNMFINGISKYMMYILKVFKAYSVDFISENNVMEIDAERNYQYNIDQIGYNVDLTFKDNFIFVTYTDEVSLTNANVKAEDINVTGDSVSLKTPVGTIKIGG